VTRSRAAAAAVTAGAVVAALVAWYSGWQHWAARETGSLNTPGTPPNYNFWSGFGSVWPWSMGVLVTLLLLAYHALRRNNCHVHRCWRIGTHPVADGSVVTCGYHHAKITGRPRRLTVEHLRQLHRDHHGTKALLTEIHGHVTAAAEAAKIAEALRRDRR